MGNKKTEILRALTTKHIEMIKTTKLYTVQGGGSCVRMW